MSELTIRNASAGDATALAELIGQLGYPITAGKAAERLPRIVANGGATLVGEQDGAVIACLTTSTMEVLHRAAPVGRVSMFVVRADLRGSGIGKAMLDHAVRHLRSAGCEVVEVTSNIRRNQAHAFYEHLGWERTSYRFSAPIDD